MKLGVIRSNTDVPRAMWRSLSHGERLLAVALGLYAIDAEGRPVIQPEMLAVRLKEIQGAMGASEGT